MKKTAWILSLGLLVAAAMVPGQASSHREAPLIALDPTADNTDVYAFVDPNDPDMATEILSLSNQLADVVANAAPSVVQVQGRRRPASGLVYADGVVLTTVRALGREDGVRVRRHDGTVLDAELAGWDPTTSLALLRVAGLDAPPLVPAAAPARVGHLAVALARSWSNAVTASAGLVSVIGGPLATGRRRSIDEVIRTSAPMLHKLDARDGALVLCGLTQYVRNVLDVSGLTSQFTIVGTIADAVKAMPAGEDTSEHAVLARRVVKLLSIGGQLPASPQTIAAPLAQELADRALHALSRRG